MTEPMEARELFRSAYENRYTWDSNFPGYTADVTYRSDDRQYTGKIRINQDCTFDVTDVEDEEAKKEIQGQVWETSIHRVRRAFEETHGKNVFTLGKTDDAGAVEVFVEGKSMGDRYKVRANEITLVHRHIRDVVVTINTYSSHETGEGYLSHRYDSVYTDAETGTSKGGKSDFEDIYEKVGDYYVMTQRTIRTEEAGKVSTSEFAFSNVKLLQPALV